METTTIVKIGTESLTDFNKSEKVNRLVKDIAIAMQRGIRIILVSSGAVGFGGELLPEEKDRYVLASIGQPVLMHRYAEKFQEYGIRVGQILATHATLQDLPDHRQQCKRMLDSLCERGHLPIINENDPLSTEEMRKLRIGADNDWNSLLISELVGAKDIIMITNTNGIYADRSNAGSRISRIAGGRINDTLIESLCGTEKSGSGTGGMASKLKIGKAMSDVGGQVYICDGITSGVLDYSHGDAAIGGTIIHP